MAEDWKDALAALRGLGAADTESNFPTDNDAADAAEADAGGATVSGRRTLRLFYEKKGRAGKPATIIEGFDPDDDTEALAVASNLKKRIGCGGSARGGEILLQGDRRQQAAKILREMGHTVKGG
ncbi:MAG: translation initiation factor [Bacteroides sp.]|nr:translation initiation factor [Bacteroidales bacterium]MBD5182016.1 translation initiation factor [Bacteroidales bacterium]MBD5292385.1 translation initiation factor [Bacteroides sp.]